MLTVFYFILKQAQSHAPTCTYCKCVVVVDSWWPRTLTMRGTARSSTRSRAAQVASASTPTQGQFSPWGPSSLITISTSWLVNNLFYNIFKLLSREVEWADRKVKSLPRRYMSSVNYQSAALSMIGGRHGKTKYHTLYVGTLQ